jgi:hypothetical protein
VVAPGPAADAGIRSAAPHADPSFISELEARSMSKTFHVAPVLTRHAASMRAQHPTHRHPAIGCPDCLVQSSGRGLTIRYSPARP